MAKTRKQTMVQASRAKSPQEKAAYHVVTGAGRSRVIRDFFNLGPGDDEAITRLLQTRVSARLQRGS